jgi:hypothetical protein
MKISARVDNSHQKYRATVRTNDAARDLSIPLAGVDARQTSGA